MKILVIGGGGQLGSKIIQHAGESHDIYATYMNREPNVDKGKMSKLDKTDSGAVFALISKIKPDVVIDTAALHNVDYCELNQDEAKLVNATGTGYVAEACKENGSKMVFISTDYVFDGKNGNYKEDDDPTPVNYYGVSKLDGERAVQSICENHIIIRPSVIYGKAPPNLQKSSSGKPLNFVMWLMGKLEKNEPVNIVNDQYSTPTLSDSLAQTILMMCGKDVTCLYHVSGKTRLNRYDLSVKVAEKMGLDKSLIIPIDTSQLNQKAKRPMDSSLNVEKVENALNIKMPTIDEALDIFKQ